MVLLRVILIIIIVFYAIKLIFRYLFPIFIKKQIEKMSNNSNFNHNKKEGEVTIEDKNISNEDFTDYEEID
jgi:hypothetical protein